MEMGFTMDEVEAELKQAAQDMLDELEKVKAERRHNDPGHTVVELAVAWGVQKSMAKKKVAELKKAGRIIEGRAYRLREDGHFQSVRVVRLREEGKDGLAQTTER